MAGNLRNVRCGNQLYIPLFGIAYDGFGYGVRTVSLCRGGKLYQLLFLNSRLCLSGLYIEGAFGQRTRLVEYHRVELCDGIEVVATSVEDTQAGGGADPSEAASRTAYDEGAREEADRKEQCPL